MDGDKVEEIERLVADYRRSLYEHEWERGMVAREMSQLVEDSVVVAYYEAHKNKFILRETILRGVLLVVPKSSRRTRQKILRKVRKKIWRCI